MTNRKKCGKKFALRLPQMEYTRFAWAANAPPCPGEGAVDVARKGRFESALIYSHCGVSSRPFLPQDKESSLEIHRTQKKRFSFSRSLAYSICWVRGYHGKNKMLSAASLIGTEGDDSCGNSTCLKTP